jgi:hypothetical protein
MKKSSRILTSSVELEDSLSPPLGQDSKPLPSAKTTNGAKASSKTTGQTPQSIMMSGLFQEGITKEQPSSQEDTPANHSLNAGSEKKGKDDNRYLWPQMLEIIRTSRPSWVVAENVPNVIKMALPTVIPDLEKIGYESVLLLIPALGVGAPHRRRRAWVVSKSLDSNSDGIGLYREKMHEHNQGNLSELENQQGSLVGQMVSPQVWESIDPRVLGVANGLPDRMDREEKQDRINRIKGLGNAIVPQLAYELLKPIAEMELKGYTVSHVNRKKSSHIGSQEEDGSPDIFM